MPDTKPNKPEWIDDRTDKLGEKAAFGHFLTLAFSLLTLALVAGAIAAPLEASSETPELTDGWATLITAGCTLAALLFAWVSFSTFEFARLWHHKALLTMADAHNSEQKQDTTPTT